MTLNAAGRAVIEAGGLAHLVTLNKDGSPQVSVIWVGLDGDELVSGHLDVSQLKVRNMQRDPRVTLSIEAPGAIGPGLKLYIVIHATVRFTGGGAAELLHTLAQTYLEPGSDFPGAHDTAAGLIAHYTVRKITGMGDWRA